MHGKDGGSDLPLKRDFCCVPAVVTHWRMRALFACPASAADECIRGFAAANVNKKCEVDPDDCIKAGMCIVQRRCGPLPDYFSHLFSYVYLVVCCALSVWV